MMQLSENGLKFVKRFEGCHLYWYQLDDGGLTTGYGHWVPHSTAKKLGIKKGDKITQAQADQYLKEDMQKFVNHTNKIVTEYGFTGKLNQSQFDTLVSYCYNRGPGNSKGTNGLRQLLKNSKTVADISKNLLIYWGTNQTYKKGLLNRRKAEQGLFNTRLVITVPAPKSEVKGVRKLDINSPALQSVADAILASKERRELIVKHAISKGFANESWLEKLNKKTITNDEILVLAAKAIVDAQG